MTERNTPGTTRPFSREEAIDIVEQCVKLLDSIEKLLDLAKESLKRPDLRLIQNDQPTGVVERIDGSKERQQDKDKAP